MLQQEVLEFIKIYDIPPKALSLRGKTRQGQSPPSDSDVVAAELAATARRRIVEENITIVYNADQTAVFFEYVPKHTNKERGSETMWVKYGGKRKEYMTAMRTSDSTARKYALWVVVKMRSSKMLPLVMIIRGCWKVDLQHLQIWQERRSVQTQVAQKSTFGQ
ncbi:hypothetical protein PHMEG_00018617 [Phytophthora megakarya]|uniref:Uncharacterized protein n=1 Tax=Phytophthora megakarya TaxID=4795 RepID=A0A225VUG7_9STRA|nr:hypothetical protein PHMEG_00018617 [Phytophthora megakarya]